MQRKFNLCGTKRFVLRKPASHTTGTWFAFKVALKGNLNLATLFSQKVASLALIVTFVATSSLALADCEHEYFDPSDPLPQVDTAFSPFQIPANHTLGLSPLDSSTTLGGLDWQEVNSLGFYGLGLIHTSGLLPDSKRARALNRLWLGLPVEGQLEAFVSQLPKSNAFVVQRGLSQVQNRPCFCGRLEYLFSRLFIEPFSPNPIGRGEVPLAETPIWTLEVPGFGVVAIQKSGPRGNDQTGEATFLAVQTVLAADGSPLLVKGAVYYIPGSARARLVEQSLRAEGRTYRRIILTDDAQIPIYPGRFMLPIARTLNSILGPLPAEDAPLGQSMTDRNQLLLRLIEEARRALEQDIAQHNWSAPQ